MTGDRNDVLDEMLAAPLDDVADDGFSARIAARVTRTEMWRERLGGIVPVLGACALVPFLPLREFGDAMVRLTPLFADSVAVSIAAAALILTFSLERRLRD